MKEIKYLSKIVMKSLPFVLFNLSGISSDIPEWAKEKTPPKISYYFGLGTGFPIGDLSDGWGQGFHGFGRIDFAASPMLNIWAGAEYHYFSFEDQPDTSVTGHDLSTVNLAGDMKLNLTSANQGISPYFIAGAGLAIRKISDSTFRIYGDTLVNRGVVTYKTSTKPFFEIGGGVEYKMIFL
ncbi:MAG TPA: hypothetical protein VHP63_06685, partial [candidate division Zixibacteria bacterium]|nr:hypothetical protein [candidate division Zixibacteria bacterium]